MESWKKKFVSSRVFCHLIWTRRREWCCTHTSITVKLQHNTTQLNSNEKMWIEYNFMLCTNKQSLLTFPFFTCRCTHIHTPITPQFNRVYLYVSLCLYDSGFFSFSLSLSLCLCHSLFVSLYSVLLSSMCVCIKYYIISLAVKV